MVRTQIQLTKKQMERLKEYAAHKGVSLAEIIRRSVDLFFKIENEREEKDKLYLKARETAGKYDSRITDLAKNHDRYLQENFK